MREMLSSPVHTTPHIESGFERRLSGECSYGQQLSADSPYAGLILHHSQNRFELLLK